MMQDKADVDACFLCVCVCVCVLGGSGPPPTLGPRPHMAAWLDEVGQEAPTLLRIGVLTDL